MPCGIGGIAVASHLAINIIAYSLRMSIEKIKKIFLKFSRISLAMDMKRRYIIYMVKVIRLTETPLVELIMSDYRDDFQDDDMVDMRNSACHWSDEYAEAHEADDWDWSAETADDDATTDAGHGKNWGDTGEYDCND
jgi:hypothetical protein